MPEVSAIIIFLDEERYLAAAIDSVRAQTFTDWELILVDDGSRDRSGAIARVAAASDHRIRYMQHPGGANRGMSASRNLGLSAAGGEYVAFLDGDDDWLPTKLSEQVAILAHEPGTDMLYGRTVMWRSWNGGVDFFYDLGVPADVTYKPPRLFHTLLHNRAQTPTSINAMMRRRLIARVGGFEDEFASMFEDQVFFAKALLAGACHVSSATWARYRQHAESCTATAGAAAEFAARRRYLAWVDAYVGATHPGRRDLARRVARSRLDLRVQEVRHKARRLRGRT